MVEMTRLVSCRPVVVLRFVVTQIKIWLDPMPGKVTVNHTGSGRKMCELTLNYAPTDEERPWPTPSFMTMPEAEVREGLLYSDLSANSVGGILRLGFHNQICTTDPSPQQVVDSERYTVVSPSDAPNWPLVTAILPPNEHPPFLLLESMQEGEHNKLVEFSFGCPVNDETRIACGFDALRVMPMGAYDMGVVGASMVGRTQRL